MDWYRETPLWRLMSRMVGNSEVMAKVALGANRKLILSLASIAAKIEREPRRISSTELPFLHLLVLSGSSSSGITSTVSPVRTRSASTLTKPNPRGSGFGPGTGAVRSL